MKIFLERSALLRTLNYIRVKHPHARRYNFYYPTFLSIIVCILIYKLAPNEKIFSIDGFISKFNAFLGVIAPFFIASLAAVSTFSGPKGFDQPFEMSTPVTLQIKGSRGAWQEIEVSPRHFLSLLFGYCSVISLLLLMFTILAPFLSSGMVNNCGRVGEFLKMGILFVFLSFFFQVIVATLVGIYYLSDKLHREI